MEPVWRSETYPVFLHFLEECSLKIWSGLPEVASRSAVFKMNNHSQILVVPILSRDANKAEHQNLYSAPVKGWGSQDQSGPCCIWFLTQYLYDYLFFTAWLRMNSKVPMLLINSAIALTINYLNSMCRPSITFGTRLVNLHVSLPHHRNLIYLLLVTNDLIRL